MDAAALEQVCGAFQDFHAYFSPLFGRRESREHGQNYLQALLVQSQDRRNAENLSESVGVSARGMQRFLTEAPWDDDLVMGRLQEYLGPRLEHGEGVWVLDGSDFPKQGVKSVGVARQYCGRLGKVANCQAGMFLAYVSPLGRALVDKRLYLPVVWTSDAERCQAAGVPEERRRYRSKTELALEMVEQALDRGHLRAGWVAGDDAFGMSPSFREGLFGKDCQPWGWDTSWTFRRTSRYGLRSPSGPVRLTKAKGAPANPSCGADSVGPWGSGRLPFRRKGGERSRWLRGARGRGSTSSAPSGCGPPRSGNPARSIGRSFDGTWTAASHATTCPTPLRTLPWKPWPGWAAPDGALKLNSRPRRAMWGWMSTRPAPGEDGIITSPCACWRGHSC